jgi:hypothetical protein
LCHIIDNHEIEKKQNLSPDTWEYIKKNNFMGLVISKQFNGKGFSPHAHSLIVEKIAGRNIAAAVSVMVPNSLGPGELLYHYGTEEQKNYYLPKLADGTHIPYFGLTTETSGSDAVNIITSIENNDKKGFGENFNKIIYHTFYNLVKSVYYGIYLKLYRNKNEISQYHEIQLNRHVANFAFIANMGLLMGGKIKTVEYISGRYADILSDIYMSYACLWYYIQNK